MDRVHASGAWGREFESHRARHLCVRSLKKTLPLPLASKLFHSAALALQLGLPTAEGTNDPVHFAWQTCPKSLGRSHCSFGACLPRRFLLVSCEAYPPEA